MVGEIGEHRFAAGDQRRQIGAEENQAAGLHRCVSAGESLVGERRIECPPTADVLRRGLHCRDQQTAASIIGHAALCAYLERLFSSTPLMTYVADEVWAIPGGYCGRWYCDMADAGRLRGFDLMPYGR